MKKKVKIGFSVDPEISEEFDKYCQDRTINKSKLVNKILKDFLNEKKKVNYVKE
jgi:metal-responsive CopG/Arc/MetJ family transcriptional regulator